MPRGRAQLSEKQERILVQCQLMGLTTRDMTQISNRLRALDKEREFKERVNLVTAGMAWKKEGSNKYLITASDGRVYDCFLKKISGSYRWERQEEWTIKVTHPGTRMKEKIFTKERIYSTQYEEVTSACPDQDKKLYRLLDNIYRGKWR